MEHQQSVPLYTWTLHNHSRRLLLPVWLLAMAGMRRQADLISALEDHRRGVRCTSFNGANCKLKYANSLTISIEPRYNHWSMFSLHSEVAPASPSTQLL
jgi:hypothetical protein